MSGARLLPFALFASVLMVCPSTGEGRPEPTATLTPSPCFTVEPASVEAGEQVVVDGDCPGLLHHRFIRIFFDCTLVAEWDFGGGSLFSTAITVPPTTEPGLHAVRVAGPFLDVSAEVEVTGEPRPCDGDCDLDDRVTVAELVTGTSIAMGNRPLDDCTSFDADEDERVSIDELVSGVAAALQGCDTPSPCAASR